MGYEETARMNHRKGNNCAVSIYRTFSDELGISEEEAAGIAPPPRSEGGLCGAYLAGCKLLESVKPEALEEFKKRFFENNRETHCANLITERRKTGKTCNDLVGETTILIEELLNK
ncbi:MAG: C-GCAxxG-C-C family protein [Lachnospiraceae bacterium]|nr:C-GCAxxG-C-C family protein [Lachnospiraceae bacterium]